MLLDLVNSPKDIKGFDSAQLNDLAAEIRDILLHKMSIRGGHFGSNFGMVEATIALHYVFDSPKDKIVFDVSHQCYTHKILTGRKEAFIDPDKYADVSGYTNPNESEHDFFNVGHTSTSVSLACGLAKARDLLGGKENIIAVIGDGALSGGEAYEGLDYARELNSNLIVVVNDNQMSIAENHGGLYKHLESLRNSDGKAENNIFKALGFDYHFVKNGNSIEDLIGTFKNVKDCSRPTVVHICTKKGSGFDYAEQSKEDWHWRPPFYIETGDTRRHLTGENYDNIVCDFLIEKMKKDPSVATVVAAVPLTIGFTEEVRKSIGKQYTDVGIAEEHAISMIAGISRGGGKPVFATHSSFYQRAYDQISQELCINNLPATLLVRNASIWGMNDITHLGIFDIPLISNIPNMVYLAPTNKQEYLAMLEWSIEQRNHPVAIRIPRNGVHNANYPVDSNYDELNKYQVCRKGKQVAIVALGDFFQLGEEVADTLAKDGIEPTLINPRYITGVDDKLLDELKADHKLVITLEDGILSGGFGEKIASYYGNSDMKVLNYGLKKEFLDRYDPAQILNRNRLTAGQIIEDIKATL